MHSIRERGNAPSGESRHLRRGKTCKERRNSPHRSLRYAGVTHVYNHWSHMPFLADQHITDAGVDSCVHGATTPHAVGNVPCRSEEASGAVYEDCRRVTVDAKGGGTVGVVDSREALAEPWRRSARIYPGQPSGQKELHRRAGAMAGLASRHSQ